MSRRILEIIVIFIFGIAGGIFADQIFWPYFVEKPLFYQYRLEQAPVYITEKNETIVQENTAITKAIEEAGKTIVGVRTKLNSGKIIEGSGLIISSDGMMVTFASLIPQGSQTTIFWESEMPSFRVLKRDSSQNLILLKIEKSNLPTVGFANTGSIKLGQRVFLTGILFDINAVPYKLANEGIIKSFDSSFIKTNIFEKNTLVGSPLFDIEAKALGLNTIDSEGKVIAVPIKTIKEFAGF